MAETNTTKKKVQDEEKVLIMIPFVEGEDPAQLVGVNGHLTQIKKGEMVEVSKAVAGVLSNSNKQVKTAMANREKFKNQVTEL